MSHLSVGMGLSVADPATLVTLNSLSPSNYDSAKCPAMMSVLSVLSDSPKYPEMHLQRSKPSLLFSGRSLSFNIILVCIVILKLSWRSWRQLIHTDELNILKSIKLANHFLDWNQQLSYSILPLAGFRRSFHVIWDFVTCGSLKAV